MNRRPFRRYLWAFAPFAAIALAAVAMLGFAGGNGHEHTTAGTTHADDHVENTDSAIAFRADMRKLWEDHITWTRLAIVSIAGDLPDQGPTVGRLLQNQTDIGNAIKPFYGDAAGNQLTALLDEHINIAAEILVDAKAGDTAAENDAAARWYANANDIAAFLHSANPQQWPLADLQQMMKDHLDLTLAEAVARLSGDYPADVAAYDAVHAEILHMSDTLSLGIIDQFPKQFR
jgi:hypothetical protein